MSKPYYLCDPNKNKDCPKRGCQNYCYLTTKIECAKDNNPLTTRIQLRNLKQPDTGEKEG